MSSTIPEFTITKETNYWYLTDQSDGTVKISGSFNNSFCFRSEIDGNVTICAGGPPLNIPLSSITNLVGADNNAKFLNLSTYFS